MSDIRGQTMDLIIADEVQNFGDKDFTMTGWFPPLKENDLEEGGVFFRRFENRVPEGGYIGHWDRVLSKKERETLWNHGNGISMNGFVNGKPTP